MVYPVHPRAAKNLTELSGFAPNIQFVDPQPYLEFNFLVQNSKAVITDSGGLLKKQQSWVFLV